MADESPEHQNFSPETLGGGTVRMVMIVSDPDRAFDRAVGAGPKWSCPFVMSMDGGSEGWSIRTGTTGRSADPAASELLPEEKPQFSTPSRAANNAVSPDPQQLSSNAQ